MLLKFYHKMFTIMVNFDTTTIEHIRGEQNVRVNLLPKQVNTKKKSHHHLIIQQTILTPNVD